MSNDVRHSVRRAMHAKYAASPKRRGRYRRAIHAARRQHEARAHDAGVPPEQHLILGAAAKPARPRRVARWVVLLALLPILLVAAVGLWTANVADHAQHAFENIIQPPLQHGTESGTPGATTGRVPIPTALPSLARKEPFTILMLGVDTREGDADASHSDTIILGYVDPLEKSAHLLSIPRDLLVTMPGGYGDAKMSDVFGIGEAKKYGDPRNSGAALVRDTIEQNFRIRIDYFAMVDFNGFKKIVDTVGGVTVDNPYPIKDDAYPTEDYQFTRVFFPAGIVHLNGDEALRYARTRHDDTDYARNTRQQQVILAIREQGVSLNLLSQSTKLIDTLGGSVRTDFPPGEWIGLAKLGTEMRSSAITQFSLLDYITNSNTSAGFYALPDWPHIRAYMKQFSPKESNDVIAAATSTSVNKNAKIVMENGTRKGGFANRWSDALGKQGYTHVSFVDAPPNVKGNVPVTKIYAFGASGDTARVIATILKLKPDRVQVVTKRPPDAPTDLPSDTAILVVLGDDALEPG